MEVMVRGEDKLFVQQLHFHVLQNNQFIWKTLEKIGIVSRVKDVHYRHTDQTVWEIHADKFLENLERYPRWV